jgi:predicted AAA+ superfamily ATPase
MGNFIRRNLETRLRFSLLEDSVIYLTGPRGVGKKSLYLSLKEQFPYLSFEEDGKLAAAKENPIAFVQSIPAKTIIDHSTLAPEIFKPMSTFITKLRLANNGYVAGQFLLTGICKIDSVPSLPVNLTGQLRVLTLLPFAAAEIVDNGDINFIYDIFTKKFHNKKFKNIINIVEIIKKSSFASITTKDTKDIKSWYKNYLDILLKDIQFLANIDDIDLLQKIIILLTKKIGESLDLEKFAKELGTDLEICKAYITILESFYLIIVIESIEESSQKIYMMDSNLLLALSNTDSMPDIIIKNFIASELIKHIEYLDKYPYRLLTSTKVDFIVQNMQNKNIVGIDWNHSNIVTEDDFKDLKAFKKEAGQNFTKGVILYLGLDIISFGDDLFAMPISALWGGN